MPVNHRLHPSKLLPPPPPTRTSYRYRYRYHPHHGVLLLIVSNRSPSKEKHTNLVVNKRATNSPNRHTRRTSCQQLPGIAMLLLLLRIRLVRRRVVPILRRHGGRSAIITGWFGRPAAGALVRGTERGFPLRAPRGFLDVECATVAWLPFLDPAYRQRRWGAGRSAAWGRRAVRASLVRRAGVIGGLRGSIWRASVIRRLRGGFVRRAGVVGRLAVVRRLTVGTLLVRRVGHDQERISSGWREKDDDKDRLQHRSGLYIRAPPCHALENKLAGEQPSPPSVLDGCQKRCWYPPSQCQIDGDWQ